MNGRKEKKRKEKKRRENKKKEGEKMCLETKATSMCLIKACKRRDERCMV